jgi:hypothetical protein
MKIWKHFVKQMTENEQSISIIVLVRKLLIFCVKFQILTVMFMEI